jgi:hypothetical protein
MHRRLLDARGFALRRALVEHESIVALSSLQVLERGGR